MPPESLFRHTLQCPSSPGIIDLSILDFLHYPNSLKSEEELRKENRFVQSLGDTDGDADLCLSIDDYGDFGSNFYYKDCPSVYCSTELDTSQTTFNLPSVLAVHCANFIGKDVRESKEFSKVCLGILSSDILAVRKEVEAWNDCPHSCSLAVVQVILGLGLIRLDDLAKWMISNSPCYGIVIDISMRDHIIVLWRLCLKATLLEAHRSTEFLMNGNEGNGGVNFSSLRFNCPVLVEAMTWLASQLSVLYGEPNGRFFSVSMLKHCILNAASSLSLFSSAKNKTETRFSTGGFEKTDANVSVMSSEVSGDNLIAIVKVEEPTEEFGRADSFGAQNNSYGLVFVSQVAAAIAALRERSLLEEKIKSLRVAGLLPKSQRLAQHAYVIMRAYEERKKRSNYRPILEHDGLLWHRSRNQDSNKNKTREELLAEERDYKRRRMSYRGKKVKRSTTEVMRDIIEKHMDEINQAGGIGCFVKGSAEMGMLSDRTASVDDIDTDNEYKKVVCNSIEPNGEELRDYSKQFQERQKRVSHGHNEPLEDQQKNSRNKRRDREYRSRSPDKYRSHGLSHEKHRYQRDHDEMERIRSKYDKNESVSPHRSKYHDRRSFSSVSNPSTDLKDRKYDSMSEHKEQYRGRTYGSRRSESVTQSMFEDRYDPSESGSGYNDGYGDESSGKKYVRRR
ncbi:U11/U12 small nuclear ribonucleoprotein [Thalictrum thalictroides]|uniref:U11/U12 small nuclear ribonucleoprotein n=1 Tax=Thalictrum thalictroides TaxID=46969 RepID=A0A7J6VGK1_THATH|nr:U11/U12 small nuclear ribonucleoprotein [Thalictrum thalictroides]